MHWESFQFPKSDPLFLKMKSDEDTRKKLGLNFSGLEADNLSITLGRFSAIATRRLANQLDRERKD